MEYSWDFSGVLHYLPAFGSAVVVTALLAVLSSGVGTLLGAPIALLLRVHPVIRIPLTIAVDALRAIPNLVLIFFFYYFPYKQLLGTNPLSPFMAALLALIVAQAAYSADAIRTALHQVPRTQLLAARSLGLQEHHVWRQVVLPSVVKQTLPVHIALWIGNLKLSSLASVVGVQEVVFVAKVSMSQSYRSLEAWVFVGVIYIVMVLPVTYGLRAVEKSDWIRRQ